MATTRITENILSKNAEDSMIRTRNKLLESHEQASTGKRINRPSDDPVGIIRATDLKVVKDRNEKVGQNIEWATNLLNVTDGSLGELFDVLSRAKELALQLSSTTNQTEDSRRAASYEINQLNLRAVQIGNTRLGDRYIFAGHQTDRPPFDGDGNYFGDVGITEIEVDRSQRVSLNLPGTVPFFGISEITKEMQKTRDNAVTDKVPTIKGDLRAPASVVMEVHGVDPNDTDKAEEITRIQNNSGVNLFNELKAFSTALAMNDDYAIHAAIDGIDGAMKQVIAARATIGARQNLLTIAQRSLDANQESNASLLSQLEDADTIKVFHELSRNENLLNTSLETSKKLLTKSLMDFLK